MDCLSFFNNTDVNAYTLIIGHAKPEIQVPPADTHVGVEGHAVTLTCKVIGAPIPTVTWLKDNIVLNSERYHVLEEGSLQISVNIFHNIHIQS